MDKTKWIRLIQWKFGGCGVYESLRSLVKSMKVMSVFSLGISRATTEREYRDIYSGLNGHVSCCLQTENISQAFELDGLHPLWKRPCDGFLKG
jgi:hypothetical protein